MSIGPIKPSETGATPPPIKPEKQHPITKMFQKVCTFVRSPIQTLRGRKISKQSAPIISQKKLGQIKATLERKYGITPSNKDITSLEDLVNDIKEQTPTKSFLDTELREDDAGRIIMAAHLLREGESASVGDALKRARGRFAQHKLTTIDLIEKHPRVFWPPVVLIGVVTAVIAVFVPPIVPVAVLAAAVGIPTIGLTARSILRHRTIAKWEGTDPKISKQIQKTTTIAKKTLLSPSFRDLVEDALYNSPLHWRIPGNLKEKEFKGLAKFFNRLIPPRCREKVPRSITERKEWCENFLAVVEEEQKKIAQTPLVISTPGASQTPVDTARSPVKNASQLSSNISTTLESLTNLKNFLDPPKDTKQQKLQLDWHTKDWKMIREKLKNNDFDTVLSSLQAEGERIRGGICISPFEKTQKAEDRRDGLPIYHDPFRNICEKHQAYLNTITEALKKLDDNHLNEFLKKTDTGYSFDALIEIVNKDLPDSQKIWVPEEVYQSVPKNLVFDWSYTRHWVNE